jgi:hypothetical protein
MNFECEMQSKLVSRLQESKAGLMRAIERLEGLLVCGDAH